MHGRNKIQDVWDPTLTNSWMRALYDNVYSLQVADNSGPVNNVNKRKMLNTITNWENMREEELLILCFITIL